MWHRNKKKLCLSFDFSPNEDRCRKVSGKLHNPEEQIPFCQIVCKWFTKSSRHQGDSSPGLRCDLNMCESCLCRSGLDLSCIFWHTGSHSKPNNLLVCCYSWLLTDCRTEAAVICRLWPQTHGHKLTEWMTR